MNLLCTNSDVRDHFQLSPRIERQFGILYLDRPYDLLVSLSEIVVSQSDRVFKLQSGDSVLFLLFRAAHEKNLSPADSLTSIESLQLFKDACSIIGVTEHNGIEYWERAYLKTALIRLAHRFSGLVPPVTILDGVNSETVRTASVDRIVKSGYGIRRAVDGLMPQATLKPAGKEFVASKRYRYAIQDYIRPEREVRAYVTRGANEKKVTLLNMPVASEDCPDWRDDTELDQLVCAPVEDSYLASLSLQLCTELELGYVCFDFLQGGDRTYLLDVNPHGSWEWLPASCRQAIDRQVESWVLSLIGDPL
jgi:hypothetical protein